MPESEPSGGGSEGRYEAPPWRTQPDIREDRKQHLADCLSKYSDPFNNSYPFSEESLTRADLEWLLSVRIERSADYELAVPPVQRTSVERPGEGVVLGALAHEPFADPSTLPAGYEWYGFSQDRLKALDLRSADLSGLDLSDLPLDNVKGGVWDVAPGQENAFTTEMISSAAVNLEGCNLNNASFRRAVLIGANLKGARGARAIFDQADLRATDLSKAALQQCSFVQANLSNSFLVDADLRGGNLSKAHLGRTDMRGVDLSYCYGEGCNFVRSVSVTKFTHSPADLREAKLISSRFEGAQFGSRFGGVDFAEVVMHDAVLCYADLDSTNLSNLDLSTTDLRGASLVDCKLQGAVLGRLGPDGSKARIVGPGPLPPDRTPLASAVNLALKKKHIDEIGVEDVDLGRTDSLVRVRKWLPAIPDEPGPADLRGAYFGSGTRLDGLELTGDSETPAVLVEGVRWGDVNLAAIRWDAGPCLGDELSVKVGMESWRKRPDVIGEPEIPVGVARRSDEAALLAAAIRANTQFATALRAQGLTELGDRFGYRAKVLQARSDYVRRKFGRWVGASLLDLLSGYGFKPLRGIVAYAIVIIFFGVLYWLVHGYQLPQAFVASINAAQGRGVAVDSGGSGASVTEYIGAVEALVGLSIEVIVTATFAQRFLSR